MNEITYTEIPNGAVGVNSYEIISIVVNKDVELTPVSGVWSDKYPSMFNCWEAELLRQHFSSYMVLFADHEALIVNNDRIEVYKVAYPIKDCIELTLRWVDSRIEYVNKVKSYMS